MSRPPVRDAFLQLQREGFLTLRENRGFFVPELTEREAGELYPIVHALEDLALSARLADAVSPEQAITLNPERRRVAERRGTPGPGEAKS